MEELIWDLEDDAVFGAPHQEIPMSRQEHIDMVVKAAIEWKNTREKYLAERGDPETDSVVLGMLRRAWDSATEELDYAVNSLQRYDADHK